MQRPGEVFAPVRIADQKRMQADRHHAAGRGALLVEHVELIADHLAENLRALMQIEERRNVVDLHRIGHGDHRALLHPHRVGLVIVDPVADIVDAVLGQDIERAHGLAQSRAEPAARRFADALGDRSHDCLDERAFLRFRLAGEQGGIVVAMAHPLPVEFSSLFDDARIALADVGVQRDGPFDAVALHHLHHPPDADAHPVVAPRIVQDIRVDRQIGQPRRWPVEQKMLDVRDHPDGDASAVRPRQTRPVDDRGIVEAVVLGRHGWLRRRDLSRAATGRCGNARLGRLGGSLAVAVWRRVS